MNKIRKRITCLVLLLVLPGYFTLSGMDVSAASMPNVEAPSYVVMEASTGQIICEQDADSRRSPASITKIMTLLITFEHLKSGRIHLNDYVMTSGYAQSMGGSQVFLEEGETQTLETMIKCIAVASGNDASVAVAEYIAGSEQEFVKLMNAKAEELGLQNTHFTDCCGLSESDEHFSSARDIAIMSRELITKYPEVFQYTKIWMEDIIHNTPRGESVFTLSSTNRLLKLYDWTTGLKTGSTSKAKYCLAATAQKDNMELIAVVMASPNTNDRFRDAMALLNYGYSVSKLYTDENKDTLPEKIVKGGVESTVNLCYEHAFEYLDTKGSNFEDITKEISLPSEVEAPVEEGQPIGEAVYKLGGTRIGSVSIVAAKSIKKATCLDYYKKMWKLYLR